MRDARFVLGSRYAVALAAVLGAVVAAGCHPPPAAQPAPIARFQAVSGGAGWDGDFAIATTATVTVGDMTGQSETLQDIRTGRHRTSLKLGPLSVGDGFDGTAAWELAPGGEVKVSDAPANVARAMTERWMTARGYFRAGGASYRELGARVRGGMPCHAIEATPAGGAPIELWFDDATGRLVQTVHKESIETVVTTYDDYRRVGGVDLAFRTVVDQGDPRNRTTAVITHAELRPAAAAAAYARPSGDDGKLRFAAGAHETRVPFEPVTNHIFIQGQVDGKPLRLLVDTGGLNVLSSAAAARLGLASEGKLAVSGVGDTKADMGFARAHELAVGDLRLADPMFYVIDVDGVADSADEAFDGLVGFELFHRLAVRIDYARRELVLTEPDRFAPPAGAIAVPFELHDRIPLVSGSVDGVPARFTIDTGSRSSLDLTSPFVRAHGLEARYHPRFEAVTGWGVGGASRSAPVRFGEVRLGDAVVQGAVGSLFTGNKGAFADPDSAGNIGGSLLRRFAVTFDYRGRTMYLEPVPGVPREVYDRAGMFLLRAGDTLRVAGVAPDGPAARAGVAVEDRIVAVDGAAVASRPTAAWRALLTYGEIGARHTLTLASAGAARPRRDVALVLAELLP